ncbi:MAG: hypothetical protein RLZZ262_844 [Bacteroidota bacterium]|jgi:hypothetical protein
MSENYKDDVFTHSVRAGKRTYFFDVKATKGKDLFMTITESKRVNFDENGPAQYEKHKIFLYKEDFDGFIDGLHQAIEHIRELQGKDGFRSGDSVRKSKAFDANGEPSEITFEDLD